MKKILLISLCVFKLAMVEGQEKENPSVKHEDLNEVVVKGKRKLHKTLQYEKVATLKSPVFSFGSQIVDGKVYVMGGDVSFKTALGAKIWDNKTKPDHDFGFKDFVRLMRRYRSSYHSYSDQIQVFDLESKKWIKNKVKLSNRAYHNMNYYNGNFYILGGKRLSKNKRFEYLNGTIEVLNIDSLSTKVDDTNPHQAINFASKVYKNYMVVMGGSFKKRARGAVKYSNESHFFDFKTGLWYELPQMPLAKEVKGVLVKHKFYLIGGYNGKELSGIESFDFINGQWKQEISLPLPMKKPGLAVSKNRIFIYDKNIVFVYDTLKGEMRKYYIGIELEESNLHIYQGALYIIGGFTNNKFDKEPSGNIYKIDLKEFNKTESLNF